MKATLKTLNIRLGEQAYEALRLLANIRGVSMNRVVEEQILASAEAERQTRLKQAFAKIAALPEAEQSVEFAFDAQREVVLAQE